jgi:hypothetical protein
MRSYLNKISVCSQKLSISLRVSFISYLSISSFVSFFLLDVSCLSFTFVGCLRREFYLRQEFLSENRNNVGDSGNEMKLKVNLCGRNEKFLFCLRSGIEMQLSCFVCKLLGVALNFGKPFSYFLFEIRLFQIEIRFFLK